MGKKMGLGAIYNDRKIADRLKRVLDGGTDPEVCLFQIFGAGGQPEHPRRHC